MIFGSRSQEVGDLPVDACRLVSWYTLVQLILMKLCRIWKQLVPTLQRCNQRCFSSSNTTLVLLSSRHLTCFLKFHFCRYLCGIAIFKIACALSWSSDYMNTRHISWILFRQLDHFGHEPEVIFLLGHWNNEGLGCTKRMAVPEIHEALMQIPGCSGFGRHE